MELSPAYFAMVMATGIVYLSAHMLGMPRLAATLFGLNIAAYLAIGLLTLLRVVWFRGMVLRDLVDHQRGPGFFTSVAASCLLGSQFILIARNFAAGARVVGPGNRSVGAAHLYHSGGIHDQRDEADPI
jgi:tellurite resistance protein TehA-like permease